MAAVHRKDALFCSSPCRSAFNNRRALRGAEIYDIFMAMRYQRHKAKGLWTLLCALAQAFREEDQRRRKDFVSWLDPDTVLARKPWLTAGRGKV